jgi:PHD/YefM family antitoxin component YafN of YafNO toxin-antitoxin module
MIQLTEDQSQAVSTGEETPPTLVDPRTQTVYVLIRKDLYEQLMDEDYNDSPWTAEERDALAWEAGKHAGWEDMNEYDDDMENP